MWPFLLLSINRKRVTTTVRWEFTTRITVMALNGHLYYPMMFIFTQKTPLLLSTRPQLSWKRILEMFGIEHMLRGRDGVSSMSSSFTLWDGLHWNDNILTYVCTSKTFIHDVQNSKWSHMKRYWYEVLPHNHFIWINFLFQATYDSLCRLHWMQKCLHVIRISFFKKVNENVGQ